MDWANAFNVFQSIFNVVMMVANVVVFSFSFIWNVKFLRITEKQEFSWIKKNAAIVSFLFVVAYLVLIVEEVIGNPIMAIATYGIVVLRPLIFLMGCVMAASARARLITLKDGGEKWMLRKFKT